MARNKYGKTRTVKHRRQRESRTDYKKRLTLLKSGTARLVIRKSLNTITAQIVQYNPDGDKVIATATSKHLVKFGWKLHTGNTPSAYLTGLLAGTMATKAKINKAIIDIGLQSPRRGGKIFAVLKGATDAGLDITHSPDALPSEDRIKGKHIAVQITNSQGNQHSKYKKAGVKPEDIEKIFEETKAKILMIKHIQA